MKECDFCGEPTEIAVKMEKDYICVKCLGELISIHET